MRFEALHQRVKRYAKNCGFKNVGKTICERMQKRQYLMFSENMEHENPLIKPELNITEKNNIIKKIEYKGTILIPKKGIVCAYAIDSRLKFGLLEGFEMNEGKLKAVLKEVQNKSFNNEILGYNVKVNQRTIKMDFKLILENYGQIFNFEGKPYAIFQEIIQF